MKHNNRPRFKFVYYNMSFFRLGIGISKIRYVLRVGPFNVYYYPKLDGRPSTYSDRIGTEYLIGTYTYLTEDYKRHWRHKIWR
jgi:hypothetical protein